MNLYSFPRNKGDELNELNELNELALFSMNSKAKPLKDRRSFFAQLPRQAMEAETTRAQATAVKDHTKLTEADFPGSFRFFFSIEGDGGPCWNGMLYYVETLPNKNLMSSCTCFFLLTVRSSDCRCFFWWESMCCPWSRGYQQGHWGPWRRVGEPTSNKGQCHGSNVYDQVRPHRSKEGCLLLFGSFLLFHPVLFLFFKVRLFVFFKGDLSGLCVFCVQS